MSNQAAQTPQTSVSTPSTLPNPRAFLTSLISSLSTSSLQTTTTTNPLKQATPAQKSILLTLHALFPNDLLPALDLLDRNLVTRFLPTGGASAQPPSAAQAIPRAEDDNANTSTQQHKNNIYYVRSARHTNRFRDPAPESTTHYEVRPCGWSCSCPAFVFAAFPATHQTTSLDEEAGGQGDGGEEEQSLGWRAGGLSLGSDVPMCKHLLACVLAERGNVFGGFVATREVGVEEFAGWAAGWGG